MLLTCHSSYMYVCTLSLITGLLITGLDWTGILKLIFMLRGMQLKSDNFGYD